MAQLSELEGTVLGLIWRDGPQTAYAIRSHFLKSRSSHFSGSAGAIYPLVERLTGAGLVVAKAEAQGKRASKLYSLTPAGRGALRGWMTVVDDWMAAVEFDPIRTRVHFLAVLTPRRRVRFIDDTLAKLDAEIAATQVLLRELGEAGDRWEVWGARGALTVLRARRSWLREIVHDMDSAG